MSRQRGRPLTGKTRSFIANNPNEKAQLSELIEGIRQYQDDEYKTMRAEFERVERLLTADEEPNSKGNRLWETRLSPTDGMQIQDPISENQPQFLQGNGNADTRRNHYQYVKWILLFFLMLFFGMVIQLYVGRLADNISSILEYVRWNAKNCK